MKNFWFVTLALSYAGAFGPPPVERGRAHPVVVRKAQRTRAMEHARRRGR